MWGAVSWNRNIKDAPRGKTLWLAMANGDVLAGWRSSAGTWFPVDQAEHNPIATPIAFMPFTTPKHPDEK